MTKNKALKAALSAAKRDNTSYFVYHDTDYPGYPGPNDYHIVKDTEYWYHPAYATLPEDSIIYNTTEGYYHD